MHNILPQVSSMYNIASDTARCIVYALLQSILVHGVHLCSTYPRHMRNMCHKTGMTTVSCIGVADWACVHHAGKGPIDNLIDHLANPAAINFTTNGVSLPGIPYMQP